VFFNTVLIQSVSVNQAILQHFFQSSSTHTVQELTHQIQQEVKRIPVELLQRVMGDVRKRLTECLEQNSGHLNDVIFEK